MRIIDNLPVNDLEVEPLHCATKLSASCHQVVPTALRGSFQSCGQNCAGVERLIVHRAVYDEFVKQFVKVVRSMRQVRPLTQQSSTHHAPPSIPNGRQQS